MNENLRYALLKYPRLYEVGTKIWRGRQKVDMRFPRLLVIETTTQCNSLCSFCSHKESKRVKKHLNINEAREYMVFLKHFHPPKDVLLGLFGFGEPLLNPIQYDIIEMGRDMFPGATISFNTNGQLLQQQKDLIANSKLSYFTVSLCYLNKESYFKHMGVDKFDQVLRGIKNYMEIDDRPHIQVHFFSTPENDKFSRMALLQEISSLLKGKDKIITYPLFDYGGVRHNSGPMCHLSYSNLSVDVDGFVYPCCCSAYWGRESIKLGHVSDDKRIILQNKTNFMSGLRGTCISCPAYDKKMSNKYGKALEKQIAYKEVLD